MKLSICIPTYNRVSTLSETLDSLLSQIVGNEEVEIVISDNASNDKTPTLVDDYIRQYTQIRYHRNIQNLGFDANIAKCVELAKGEYISLFSDDDIAMPGIIKRILAELEAVQPKILYTNCQPFRGDSSVLALEGAVKPVYDKVFDHGKEFLYFAELGFISSLTMRLESAQKFLGKVQDGLGYAHIDIAAHIALTEQGPFSYLGTVFVAARVPNTPTYDNITAVIGGANLYCKFHSDGLITDSDLRRAIQGNLLSLARTVLAKRCADRKPIPSQQQTEMINTYHKYRLFWLLPYPFTWLPLALLLPSYLLSRSISRLVRKYYKT